MVHEGLVLINKLTSMFVFFRKYPLKLVKNPSPIHSKNLMLY